MKDLMLLLAELMPFDEQIKMLKEAIEKYQVNPSDENQKMIYMHAMLLAAKEASEIVGGAENLMKKMELHERANKLFTPGEQN